MADRLSEHRLSRRSFSRLVWQHMLRRRARDNHGTAAPWRRYWLHCASWTSWGNAYLTGQRREPSSPPHATRISELAASQSAQQPSRRATSCIVLGEEAPMRCGSKTTACSRIAAEASASPRWHHRDFGSLFSESGVRLMQNGASDDEVEMADSNRGWSWS